MRSSISSLVLLSLVCPALVGAQGATVDHQKVDCIVAGKHPRMRSCFLPASQGAGSRVYFRPQDVEAWYYVEAKSDAPCHEGVLPKPSKKLVGKHVFYYVEAADRASRTVENDTIVVRSAQECKKKAASSYDDAVVAVFPGLPAGFVGGAPTAALIGAGIAAAGAAGVLVATKGDDTPTVAPPGPTTPPQTTPPTTPPPTTTPAAPLILACTANPRSGERPLRVAFQGFPSGGTGVYGFSWRFGDGGTSSQVSPSYVYNTPGGFIARLEVTSGSQVASCERSISVTAPPPPPPPPSSPSPTPGPGPFTLAVTLSGTGTGKVMSSPAGIDCLPDCMESYPNNTVVILTATTTGGSSFTGWSGGGCSGTGTCTVTMNAAQNVTATFTAPTPAFVLTVALAGSGTGTVTSSPGGINCAPDCTEPYTSGTVVTLTATPTGGSTFGGWSGGGCSGTGTCTVTMNAAQNVTALFNPPACMATLDVTKSGTGFGGVTGPGITCLSGLDCTEIYTCGTAVTLQATPSGGSTFVRWLGGGCSGTGPCNLVMNTNTTVDAQFDLVFTLTVRALGRFGGTGTVTSVPTGIDCPSGPNPPGNVCAAVFVSPQSVQLTGMVTGGGSTPVQWGGDCLGTAQGSPCTLIMNQNHTADAAFENPGFTRPKALAPTVLHWISDLQSSGAAGLVFLNGGSVGAARQGRAEVSGTAREENQVQAVLTDAHEPGTWRFELPAETVVPGSLQPLQGEVLLATSDVLVFRVQGKAGERLAFTFRLKSE